MGVGGTVLKSRDVLLRKGSSKHGLLWRFQLLLGSHVVLASQAILPHGLTWSLGAVPKTRGQSWVTQDKLVSFPLHPMHLMWSGITAATQGLGQASQVPLAFPQCWWPRL